jgi:DNA-directed RNA polymerase subunit RPC12/RpoP
MSKSASSGAQGTQGTALDSSSITLDATRRASSYFVSTDIAADWGEVHCTDPEPEINEPERVNPVYRCAQCALESKEATERDASPPGAVLVCAHCQNRVFEKEPNANPVEYSTD